MQIMVRDAYAFGDDGEEEYDGPSKSEVKRQLLALQDLGRKPFQSSLSRTTC